MSLNGLTLRVSYDYGAIGNSLFSHDDEIGPGHELQYVPFKVDIEGDVVEISSVVTVTIGAGAAFAGVVISDISSALPVIGGMTILQNNTTYDSNRTSFNGNMVAVNMADLAVNAGVLLKYRLELTPSDIALAATTVAENDAGAVIGALTVADLNDADTHTFAIDDTRFEVVGGMLKLKDGIALDFETASTLDILVTATDSFGLSYAETLTLTVAEVNNAPEGIDSTITIAEDTSHTFAAADFGFTDADGDALSAVIVTTLPTNGTLKLDGADVIAGQSISADDLDGLIWKPAVNANGPALASLGFRVVDDGGTANEGVDTDPTANTITFTVTDVADPIVGDDNGGKLKGTGGDDILRGRKGDDILLGKAGDDNLRSVGGDDILKGGKGADTFVFSTHSDRDTIVDFESGIDRIDLSKWKAIDDFGDVRDHARNHGDDVWITAGKDILVITDMHRSDLDAGDFVF